MLLLLEMRNLLDDAQKNNLPVIESVFFWHTMYRFKENYLIRFLWYFNCAIVYDTYL